LRFFTGRKRRADQILVGAVTGDAIFSEALMIRDALREWGFRSDIYAESIEPCAASEARPFARYRPATGDDDFLIFHYSLGSDIIDFVRRQSNLVRILLIYHNVTPEGYFEGINEPLAEQTRRGRRELARFRGLVQLALADSEFDRQDLINAGFRKTGVLPLALDDAVYDVQPSKEVISHFDDHRVNLLFVGRIAPNKKQADLIRAFWHYHRINPHSRLFLVGSWGHAERYFHWLKGLARYLRLKEVCFCGYVPLPDLVAYYQLADVFVSMSEHEGFCKPLLESMHFGVPILAYAAAAVPETLGRSGILIKKKRYTPMAEMIDLLATGGAFRDRVISQQKERLQDFAKAEVLAKLRLWVDSMLSDEENGRR
jgi:glycosyltransferase involved in cell wall biosynthesis